MLIAFEGPDEVGKSTSAAALSSQGMPVYYADRQNYANALVEAENAIEGTDHVITFDRVGWLTHLVYRLGMQDHDWQDDERSRPVFKMPDTHLVLKMHQPNTAGLIDAPDEGYQLGKLAAVNQTYFYMVDFLLNFNRMRDYDLFKTVSIIEVVNDQQAGTFQQHLVAFDSPTNGWSRDMLTHRLVDSDLSLLAFLREEDRKIG